MVVVLRKLAATAAGCPICNSSSLSRYFQIKGRRQNERISSQAFCLPKFSHLFAKSVLANFGLGALGRGQIILSFIRDVYGWGFLPKLPISIE